MIQCTNEMENITLSPTMKTKLKNRECVNKIRHGSPKLQEVLRERCRQRMRENRRRLFNRGRFGLEINSKDVQETLTEIVRKELNNIAATDLDPDVNPFSQVIDEPLDPEEALELESEILGEEEQWILQEYERMAQEEIEFLALTADQEFAEVICPKCQVSNLTESVSQITCKSCNFVLDSSMNLKSLGQVINKCVSTHSGICKETPGILPLSEKNSTSLYLVCDKCLTFIPII
ncbi:RIP-like protein isoform X1 [Hylaeus anthracinus]|uniref:RIP-like protein isoform X1 n=1 Tax=Hylaeus anthracinus TaxID=313031 RepID=UPI0023B9C8BF|nr:RIP-like protein isoform X1 [Hylaeus anthracinus]